MYLEKRRCQRERSLYLIFQAHHDPQELGIMKKMNFKVIHEGGTQDSRPAEIYLAEEDKTGCKERGRITKHL
jgi:hypothetical protein